ARLAHVTHLRNRPLEFVRPRSEHAAEAAPERAAADALRVYEERAQEAARRRAPVARAARLKRAAQVSRRRAPAPARPAQLPLVNLRDLVELAAEQITLGHGLARS